jgi:hypothetical protein
MNSFETSSFQSVFESAGWSKQDIEELVDLSYEDAFTKIVTDAQNRWSKEINRRYGDVLEEEELEYEQSRFNILGSRLDIKKLEIIFEYDWQFFKQS